MIRLNVKEYCNNCPEFEAQINKYKIEPEIHTTVTCKNMEKCERIKEYLACVNPSLLEEHVYEHDEFPYINYCPNCGNTPLLNDADDYELTNLCDRNGVVNMAEQEVRLVNANELFELYKGWIKQLEPKEDEGDIRGVETCIVALEDSPTIDPESMRPHGKWEKEKYSVPHCSNCRKTPLLNGAEDYELSNYCPHCGARMTVDDAIKEYLV